jgi:hypothetical protein
MGNVTVNFVEQEQTINVDMSLLTWGDLLRIQKMTVDTNEDAAEIMLNSVLSKVLGQDVADLPATVVNEVLRAVMAKVQGGAGTEKN